MTRASGRFMAKWEGPGSQISQTLRSLCARAVLIPIAGRVLDRDLVDGEIGKKPVGQHLSDDRESEK